MELMAIKTWVMLILNSQHCPCFTWGTDSKEEAGLGNSHLTLLLQLLSPLYQTK